MTYSNVPEACKINFIANIPVVYRYNEFLDPDLAVAVQNMYLQAYELEELVTMITQSVAIKAQSYLLQQKSTVVPYVVVNLPVTLFMIRSSSNIALASQVARKLYFAPSIHRLADTVLAGLAEQAQPFNGAHIRFEGDAWEWMTLMGGINGFKNEIFRAMQTAGFNGSNPVYLATGLLTYLGGQDILIDLTDSIIRNGFCSYVTFKEDFLDETQLMGLHSEQKALVDLLVLAKAIAFVGFEPSTFSFFASQYRVLQGHKPESSVLVEGAMMTTNPLFEAAAVVTPGMPQFQQPQEGNIGLSTVLQVLH